MNDNFKTCQGKKNQQLNSRKTDRQITVNNQWLHIVYCESSLWVSSVWSRCYRTVKFPGGIQVESKTFSFNLLLDLDLQAKTREKSLWTADLRIQLVRINISIPFLFGIKTQDVVSVFSGCLLSDCEVEQCVFTDRLVSEGPSKDPSTSLSALNKPDRNQDCMISNQ